MIKAITIGIAALATISAWASSRAAKETKKYAKEIRDFILNPQFEDDDDDIDIPSDEDDIDYSHGWREVAEETPAPEEKTEDSGKTSEHPCPTGVLYKDNTADTESSNAVTNKVDELQKEVKDLKSDINSNEATTDKEEKSSTESKK